MRKFLFTILFILSTTYASGSQASYDCDFTLFAYERETVFEDKVSLEWSNFYGVGRYFYLVFFNENSNFLEFKVESDIHGEVEIFKFDKRALELVGKSSYNDSFFAFKCIKE